MKIILVLSLVMLATFAANAQKAPDDCSWTSTSKSRKAVKLRGATVGSGYTKLNKGRSVTVEDGSSLPVDSMQPFRQSCQRIRR